ncbi:cation:proton antiporter [Sphingomonas sp. CJ99]
MSQPPPSPDWVDLYIPALCAVGLLIFLVAWLPLILRRLPLSLPILCVGIGMALFSLPAAAPFALHPIERPWIVEKASELIVILSLMGAGLKIGRPWSWRRWALPVRLLGIAMPLTIVALLIAGQQVLGLGFATALLLAAALAPTDPVLAGDVQIEGPGGQEEDEARFGLTSEAGLNDALAFPFIHLAIAASIGALGWSELGEWALDAVAYKLGMGALVGWLGGRLIGWIIYHVPDAGRLSRTGDGFVALAATLSIYALTELAHGYGFLAVFVAGLMMRRSSDGHDFNDRMHDFADETERLMMMVLLVAFGGMLSVGGLFAYIGWRELAFAIIALFLVRPVIGWLSLAGLGLAAGERAIIAFFGIRGMGSVFYFAYGVNHGVFQEPMRIWGALGLVILMSIVLHGITVTPAMRALERHRAAR